MAGLGNPMMLVFAALIIPAAYVAFRKPDRFNKIIGLSRALILLLLVGAAAQPHIQSEQQISQQSEVVVLQDESNSAQLIRSNELEFDDVKVTERTIASGNSSDLRNALLRNLEPNTNYLVQSDFQSSSDLQGVARQFRESNSTLNVIEYETDRDAAVSIEGPPSTVPGAESRFLIHVYSTHQNVEPSITVDGEKAQPLSVDNNTWEITRSFSEKGSHTIKATLPVNDTYRSNNNYYHAIEVTDKPKLLLIGEEGPLGDKLSKFYDITYRDNVPNDLSPYYSVITTKDVQNSELTSFVTEGNGLVYTGDPTDESLDILPVKKVDRQDMTDAPKILLLVDFSTSGECNTYSGKPEDWEPPEGYEIINREQSPFGGYQYRICKIQSLGTSRQVATALIERMPVNTKIGVLLYSEQAAGYPRGTEPIPLTSQNRELLKSHLRKQPDGNSFHDVGLQAAKEVLNGTGNIVMISDGAITTYGENRNTESKSKNIASSLGNVKLYTVQVGNNPNAAFLEDLARRGNGDSMPSNQAGGLRFVFTAGGTEGRTTPLVITDRNHYITENMRLRTSVENFDRVEPKAGADQLVTGTNGNPFLTSWRYGIGRVAAFSGDTEQLTSTMRTDPLLVSRSVAWTVGDPKRNLEDWIRAENARQPDEVEIRSSYEIEGFKREAGGTYIQTVRPNSTGFGSVEGKFYGYNYNPEFEKVGYNEDMSQIVSSTGGDVYRPGEQQRLVEDIKNFSEKKIVKRQELGSYLIAIALLIFLAEVGYRKVKGKK